MNHLNTTFIVWHHRARRKDVAWFRFERCRPQHTNETELDACYVSSRGHWENTLVPSTS